MQKFNIKLKDQIYIQYGCHFSAPDSWVNFDASPTLFFERIPLIGRLYTRNSSRFPKNVIYRNVVRGLPFPDNSCAGVYASHVLEHLSLEDCRKTLRETYRVLKPDKIFRLIVPDLEKFIKEYENSPNVDAVHQFMSNTSMGIVVRSRGLFGLLKTWLGNSSHLWMWDFKALQYELENTGFTKIRRCEYGDCDDPMYDEVEDADRFIDAVAIEAHKQ